jgi:cAMP-specific phosphodiesterase 4
MSVVSSRLAEQDAQLFVDLLNDIVLSTDMACQADTLSAFTDLLEHNGPSLVLWSPPERRVVLRTLMHFADISNPARPLEHCRAWSERVHLEFFAQGDREKALGLEVAAMYDRERSCQAANQTTFIETRMRPCLK